MEHPVFTVYTGTYRLIKAAVVHNVWPCIVKYLIASYELRFGCYHGDVWAKQVYVANEPQNHLANFNCHYNIIVVIYISLFLCGCMLCTSACTHPCVFLIKYGVYIVCILYAHACIASYRT